MNVKLFLVCVIIVILIFIFSVIACVAISLSRTLQNTLTASTAAATPGIGVGGLFNSDYLDILEELEPSDKKKEKKNSKAKKNKGSKNNDPKKTKNTSNIKNKKNKINIKRGGPKSRFRSSAKSFGKSRPVRGVKKTFRKSRWRIKRTMRRVRSGGRIFLRGGLRMIAKFNPLSLLLFL